MPSGFQQDANQLAPSFYRVVLTLNGGTAAWPTADGDDNGAVNPLDWSAFTTLPSSLVNATRVARGNLRFQAIIEELTNHADAQIFDVEVTSAGNTNANNQPTAVAFTVKYERDAFLLDAYQKVLLIEDSTNSTFVGYGGGANVVNTTVKAIREMVVRAIVRGGTAGWTKKYRVYNPTVSEETVTNVTIKQPDVPADVWADVAVNLIDGTELVSVI